MSRARAGGRGGVFWNKNGREKSSCFTDQMRGLLEVAFLDRGVLSFKTKASAAAFKRSFIDGLPLRAARACGLTFWLFAVSGLAPWERSAWAATRKWVETAW